MTDPAGDIRAVGESRGRRWQYAPPARRCPTSGTVRPCGSSPPLIIVNRAAALATIPLATERRSSRAVRRARRRPAPVPATEPASTISRQPGQPGGHLRSGGVRTGTPSESGSTRSAAARVCSLASACSGARSQTGTNAPIAAATRSAPASTGSRITSASGSSSAGPAVSTADARAARTEAAADVRGQPRRFAGWRCTRLDRGSARIRRASGTPARARQVRPSHGGHHHTVAARPVGRTLGADREPSGRVTADRHAAAWTRLRCVRR